MDHKAEFQLLVMKKLGALAAEEIDWRNPRVICVANAFTRYDEHAVQQMSKSIELVRYQDFEGELLALELVTPANPEQSSDAPPSLVPGSKGAASSSKTVTEYFDAAPQFLRDLFINLENYIESLGDDVTKKTLKNYFAYRRIKNFACVEVHPQTQTLLIYLKVNPQALDLEEGFSRDVRKIGHFGTGDLELRVGSAEDLVKARALINQSYGAS